MTGELALLGQEGGQPPLYYILGAPLISRLNLDAAPLRPNPHANVGVPMQPGNKNRFMHSSAEAWPWHSLALAVHLLRFFSMLLGAGTLFFAWKTLSILWPRPSWLPLAITSWIAFLPQFLFLSAAVSNDNLIIFLSTLSLWLLLRTFGPDLQQAPSRGQALTLGLILGLAALSKLSGLALWLITALIILVHLWQRRDLKTHWPAFLLIAVSASLVAAPWYWRNWQLYGDPTALKAFVGVVGHRQTPIHPRTEFQGLRVSLLGLFGWFNIPLPNHFYQLWELFWGVSAIGLLQGLWRRRFHWRNHRNLPFLLILGLWLLLMLLMLLRWTSITPGTQGRLLFPALLSLAVIAFLGWREWLPTWQGGLIPPIIFLLVTSLYALLVVIPATYRPPATVTPAAIPKTAQLTPITFDERIQLLGVDSHPTTLHPGETIHITLYWQALQPIPYDASLYIHLLGPGFKNLAQIDSEPGWGRAPTSHWQPGQILVDSYHLQLPAHAPVPTRILVDVGLYDFASGQRYPAHLPAGQTPPPGMRAFRLIPATPPQPDIAHPTHFEIGHTARLLGYDVPQQAWHPGQTVPLSLYWQATAPINDDFQVFVHLVDAAGQQVAGFDKAPRDNWWPTSQWEPGHTFADTYPLQLPESLPPGTYQLRAGLYRLNDFYRPTITGPPARIIDNAAVLTNITLSP